MLGVEHFLCGEEITHTVVERTRDDSLVGIAHHSAGSQCPAVGHQSGAVGHHPAPLVVAVGESYAAAETRREVLGIGADVGGAADVAEGETRGLESQADGFAAESLVQTLKCSNDTETAWEIFNWVHSNITYVPITESQTFEEAAFNGFARRSGDCYVYFACSKMLLDIAGIPNLMVERYPVETNSHYWNLVQIDGLWYHCDATVFRDHPGMYFLLTDEEIDDGHHSFDASLYPERASYYGGDDYWDDSYDVYYEDSYYDSYGEDSYYDPYYDPYYDNYDDPYYWDDSYVDYDEPYGGYGPNGPYVDYEDYEYSYAPYEGEFMDSFEDAYVVNYDN